MIALNPGQGDRFVTRRSALFWCQNVYRELSQLPLRQLSD
jgi:hypothetical protein